MHNRQCTDNASTRHYILEPVLVAVDHTELSIVLGHVDLSVTDCSGSC